MQLTTGLIGTIVSGGFLILIGLLNLGALVRITRLFRRMRTTELDEAELEAQLNNRGFLARILSRVMRAVTKPWHMYPVGLLFGLGMSFDRWRTICGCGPLCPSSRRTNPCPGSHTPWVTRHRVRSSRRSAEPPAPRPSATSTATPVNAPAPRSGGQRLTGVGIAAPPAPPHDHRRREDRQGDQGEHRLDGRPNPQRAGDSE